MRTARHDHSTEWCTEAPRHATYHTPGVAGSCKALTNTRALRTGYPAAGGALYKHEQPPHASELEQAQHLSSDAARTCLLHGQPHEAPWLGGARGCSGAPGDRDKSTHPARCNS
jgi:hypothetical protein